MTKKVKEEHKNDWWQYLNSSEYQPFKNSNWPNRPRCDYIGCEKPAFNHTLKQIADNWLVEVHTCMDHIIEIHRTWFTESYNKEVKEKTNA